MYRPHKRVPAALDGTVVTKQAHKAECDINLILRQYRRTGVLQHIRANATQGAYLDLPSEIDFQAAMHIVMQANTAFESLPARTRAQFNNDPEQFLAAFTDPEREADLLALGLITPKPEAGEPSPRKEASGSPDTGAAE